MVWKMMMFEEFQDGCKVHGNLRYEIGIVSAISESPCCRKPFITFLFKRMYGLEDYVDGRIPRLLFSAWPSFLCEWVYSSYSESP